MSIALYTLRQQVGRLMGAGDAAMFTGTPAATFSTTGFTCAALAPYETSYFVDWWLRFYLGTHKDTTKTVTTFTTSTGAFVFTSALSSAVDATDLFELHRDYSPEEINDAINQAIRMIESDALVGKVDESLVVNDVLVDGLLETWTSSSALTNWSTTGAGTLARESTIKREGSYSAKLTNTASNAFAITQSVSNYPLYSGKSANPHAWVWCNTADRVRLRLTDGVSTWNSDYHDGEGWQELEIDDTTLSSVASALTVSVRIESGTQIDAYVDKINLIVGDSIYEYTLPSGFYTVQSVYQEKSTVGNFSSMYDRVEPNKGWRLFKNGTTRKLWFDPDIVALTSGRRLRLEGQATASQLTLDADTTELGAAYLVNQAAALLHMARIGEPSKSHVEQAKLFQAMADRERGKLRVPAIGWLA